MAEHTCHHGMLQFACKDCERERLCPHERWVGYGVAGTLIRWCCDKCGKTDVREKPAAEFRLGPVPTLRVGPARNNEPDFLADEPTKEPTP